MKTGDDTFDDIYISKETGKVVGVMYEDVDYKLVPLKNAISHWDNWQIILITMHIERRTKNDNATE
ncbi:hypothetical protein [uncultured Lacticaseibacillus sp.]|uniref:hypothetical protein n=1 Tax=uncultured Lacticaseibacillus sp. TaxID=2775882 RepID=UPI002582CA5D|nr:hypothetical protein [uncultured Lacticaseibacillus sp.]